MTRCGGNAYRSSTWHHVIGFPSSTDLRLSRPGSAKLFPVSSDPLLACHGRGWRTAPSSALA